MTTLNSTRFHTHQLLIGIVHFGPDLSCDVKYGILRWSWTYYKNNQGTNSLTFHPLSSTFFVILICSIVSFFFRLSQKIPHCIINRRFLFCLNVKFNFSLWNKKSYPLFVMNDFLGIGFRIKKSLAVEQNVAA